MCRLPWRCIAITRDSVRIRLAGGTPWFQHLFGGLMIGYLTSNYIGGVAKQAIHISVYTVSIHLPCGSWQLARSRQYLLDSFRCYEDGLVLRNYTAA